MSANTPPEANGGAFSFLMKENIVAKPNFNRWLVPPASMAIHLCIGSVYAWSVFNPSLTRQLGVVTSAADDWSLSSVVWIFSVAIVCLGLAAAFGGKWLEKVGPRCVGVVAALLWGGGFLIGSVGILTHQLWLVYLGYGVFGGCGLGFGYVSPVSTLIRWFPDRRGMATGMAIMGFGGGAIIGAPLKQWLLDFYSKAPDYLGPESAVTLITEGGRRFAETATGKVEVVIANAAQAANLPAGGEAGVYSVGTGNTGAAATFMTLGIVYFCVMMIAAFQYRVPAQDWKPKGWTPPVAKSGMVSSSHVHIDQSMKTRQFWLLWIVLCFNVTAGIGVIGVAKTMINEIFSDLAIVTATFAGTYVLMISVFNMVGRFFWASTSDFIGRKNTYHCFFILGTALYLSIPYFTTIGGMPALIGFYAATMVIFTMYGGGFATIPAYLADMFGTLHVGGIHGRLLTAWSTAGVLGPFAITYLRDISKNNAIADLVAKIDPAVFAEKFGAPIEQLQNLVEAKTVTISKLLEIAPAGTLDPTSSLYNTTMYTMAGLLIIAFFANLMIRPVGEHHHVHNTHPKLAPGE
ncbi:MAG: OFA family MFS transporter [Cohaesibacter sp.]|nr:OFA family MFS transporter [Cohaesibacter sp.]